MWKIQHKIQKDQHPLQHRVIVSIKRKISINQQRVVNYQWIEIIKHSSFSENDKI